MPKVIPLPFFNPFKPPWGTAGAPPYFRFVPANEQKRLSMNRARFSSPSSSSITNNLRQASEILIQDDEFALINMLFSNGQNFLLAFLTFKMKRREKCVFFVFSFLFGRKNMREATPIKEACNISPAGLMTPRDAAV